MTATVVFLRTLGILFSCTSVVCAGRGKIKRPWSSSHIWMLHSTHFIYDYMAQDIIVIKDHSARDETRCCHKGYCFQLAARFFFMHHPTDRITHVVEHWHLCSDTILNKSHSEYPFIDWLIHLFVLFVCLFIYLLIHIYFRLQRCKQLALFSTLCVS